MLLEAKKTDFEYKNGDIYFRLGEKIESNRLCITIQPTELYGFDWDLYHDGNEKENKTFEEIYITIESKYNKPGK